MDWNWFFSTLAQSSAAIVGLVGAFLVSAIISRENEFQKLTRDYDGLLEEIQFECAKVSNLSIDWYNRQRSESVTRSDLYEELVLKHQGQASIDQLNAIAAELDFSPYEESTKVRDRIAKDLGTYRQTPSSFIMPVLFTNPRLSTMVGEERERIDQERANCQALSAKVRNTIHRIGSFPRGRNLISWAIVMDTVLFFVGVICPIAFLPTDGAPTAPKLANVISRFGSGLLSLKGTMIATVALGFIVFQLLFFIKNVRQEFSSDSIQEMKRFSRLGDYSEHFKAFEENIIVSKLAKG